MPDQREDAAERMPDAVHPALSDGPSRVSGLRGGFRRVFEQSLCVEAPTED